MFFYGDILHGKDATIAPFGFILNVFGPAAARISCLIHFALSTSIMVVFLSLNDHIGRRRGHLVVTISLVMMIITSCTGFDVGASSAFSSPMTQGFSTRILYKNYHDDDLEYPFRSKYDALNDEYDNNNNNNNDIEVLSTVFGKKEDIYYDDFNNVLLDEFSKVSINEVSSSPLSTAGGIDIAFTNDNVLEDDDVIQELKDFASALLATGSDNDVGLANIFSSAIDEINDTDNESVDEAFESSNDKPMTKYISPIQLIKKVPKVLPLSKLVGEWPNTTSDDKDITSNSDTKRKRRFVEEDRHDDLRKAYVVENWKTRMMKRFKMPTAFRTTSYLESLRSDATVSSSNDIDCNIPIDDKDNDDLLRSLRTQRDQFISDRRESMMKAMLDATHRTTRGLEDIIAQRIEKSQQEREEKENELLEKMYAERKDRLNARLQDEDRASEDVDENNSEVEQ